jgi:DNA-directed RNA polymerase specialized sigma24 family protein
MGELLRHGEFLKRGHKICCWHVRRTNHDPWELFSNAYLRALEMKDRLRADNTPNASAFFGWFSQLSLNVFLDQRRKDGRELKRLLSISLPDEGNDDLGVELPDLGIDLDGERLLEEFTEFTSTLPAKRRRAIILRLENYPDKGCSYEEIAERLNGEGIKCTHVTVRSWVRASLKAFFDGSRVSHSKRAVSF